MGHYAKTERMRQYYRAMYVLMRVVGDLSFDQDYRASQSHLIYEFNDFQITMNNFAKQAELGKMIQLLDDFYTPLNGLPDAPTWVKDIQHNSTLTTKIALLNYATTKGFPKVNKTNGIGVQLLGDRYMSIFHAASELAENNAGPNDTYSLSTLQKTMDANHVLDGLNSTGFLERVKQDSTPSFFNKAR